MNSDLFIAQGFHFGDEHIAKSFLLFIIVVVNPILFPNPFTLFDHSIKVLGDFIERGDVRVYFG